ncbi:hypothetical protein P7K49_024285 [Saguinus oedipus]|uniref:Uncharacterized protein n=1 Tax=Saguinus oedipus TaxID=9490 RepID=A0ABQ9UP31_SAGOE|nr:hypothetical protein P7K49_024285 [Saguinus oedipus]
MLATPPRPPPPHSSPGMPGCLFWAEGRGREPGRRRREGSPPAHPPGPETEARAARDRPLVDVGVAGAARSLALAKAAVLVALVGARSPAASPAPSTLGII